MLAFIHLAYQMISVFLETVPRLTNIWIECLGDLARYRIAVEEDGGMRNVWTAVAGSWYVKASGRCPAVGRLYHHAGILERSSLAKLYFYGRALTSIMPLQDAWESLHTLCTTMLDDSQSHCESMPSQASVLHAYASYFVSKRIEHVNIAYNATLAMPMMSLRDCLQHSALFWR